MGIASLHAVYRERSVQATMTQMIAESQAREAESLMEEVKAYAVQNVALRDLQAALAWTPADKLHEAISSVMKEVKEQKVTLFGDEEGAIGKDDVQRLLGEAEARRRKIVLGSRVAVQTGADPGPSMQIPAVAGSSSSFGPTEKLLPALSGKEPLVFRDQENTRTLNIRPPIGPGEKGEIKIYRANPQTAALRGGRSTRTVYVCPVCLPGEYPPNTNADTVESHVRSAHLNQLLACPGGSMCMQTASRGSLFTTPNAMSLRKHWKLYGCHDHVMAQKGGKELIMSIPLKKDAESFEKEGEQATRQAAKREAPTSDEEKALTKKRKQ